MNTKQKLLCLSFTLITAGSMASASTLFEEDFNDNSAQGFSNPDSIYSTGSSIYTVNTGTAIGNNVISPSMVEVSGVAGTDFQITSSFTPSESGQGSIGFAIFGNDATISSSYYEAYVTQSGTNDSLVLREIGGNDEINTSVLTTETELLFNTEYIYTLTGIYNSGSLNLSFNVTGGGINQTISDIDSTPLTGDFFGYRTTRASGRTVADMDNFKIVAVPEPSSVALLAIGSLGILMGCGRLKRK